MQEVTPEALEAMIPKDATGLFFVYKPRYDRTQWVAYVVAELINPDLGKQRRAIFWFAKGVPEDVVQQMMQEIGELIEADNSGDSANKENVQIYFDVCTNVDASWIREAEQIFRVSSEKIKNRGVKSGDKHARTRQDLQGVCLDDRRIFV